MKVDKIFLSIISCIIIVCIFWGCLKSGMFIDEIYTYGLSNSYYKPFVQQLHLNREGESNSNLVDSILTRQEMYDYITVSKEDSFKFDSVYYNQTKDVHPPLYYLLIHLISSFFPGIFSKWLGISINIVMYIILIVLLYRLSMEVIESKNHSFFVIVLYGLSTAGISTATMVRMYILLTLFTVLLALLIIKLLKSSEWYLYPAIGFTILAGMMTQYYFVFYSFFVCLFALIVLLYRKNICRAILASISAFIGIACFCFIWPAVFDHLFAENLVSGKNAYDNFLNISAYMGRIYVYLRSLGINIILVFLLFLIIILMILKKFQRIIQLYKEKNWNKEKLINGIVIIIPVIFNIFFVSVCSPVLAFRYLYNIVPIVVLGVIYVYTYIGRLYQNQKFQINKSKLIFSVVVSIIILFLKQPGYIFLEHRQYDKTIKQYQEYPCTILCNREENAPITQNLLQLIRFKEVFVTEDLKSKEFAKYLSNYQDIDKMVIYLPIDFDILNLENIGDKIFNSYEKLYTYGGYDAVLLSYVK